VKPDSTLTIPARPYSVPVEKRESLPFIVRFAENAQDLQKAVEIRSSAFTRHFPALGHVLRDPEADDRRSDVLVLIAERKTDRRVLGSMRLQPNLFRPLRVESEIRLPQVYQDRRLVEFMRLGVENGNAGQMVMAALAKAGYEICHASRFDYILAAGRRSTSEIYRSMQFDDVFDGRSVALSYAENTHHWIFALPIEEADLRWRVANHALYDFMARTEHRDIRIDYGRVAEAFGEL
jgi:hypothetical protein